MHTATSPPFPESRRRIVFDHINIFPIIQPCSPDGLVVRVKTEWMYQMESSTDPKAKSANVASIRPNLGIDQCDVEYWPHR